MKRYSFAALAIAMAIQPASAITFGPVRAQPGQSIRLVTRSETPGGTIERKIDGKTQKGSMAVTRERQLTWTFRAPAEDGSLRGMVKVSELMTATTISIGTAKPEKSLDRSPLCGKLFALSKSPAGEWKFNLDGTAPYSQIEREINELTIYLKRQWYPTREVKIGDSWEFDPAWIKMIVEKDLSKAQTIGTMRLRQIRHTPTRDLAVIEISIRSTGADFQADGSEASASIDLSGQVQIDLNTMLDEALELNGTLSTMKSEAGNATQIKLPIHLTVNKSFVLDASMP